MTDPWKHRSEGMRCKTCMWFAPKEQTIQVQPEVKVTNLGRCRRHAPTMNGYPVVFVNDWCGDHKLNENTINPEQRSVSAEISGGEAGKNYRVALRKEDEA